MSVATAVSTALISCSGISVIHGEGSAAVHALDGVDVAVAEGEHLGLLGPSGSGKTTLLHALGGLISPTSGVVSWRGQPLASLDRSARRSGPVKGIAYIFQGANLLPHFDARENIAFAMRAARRRTSPRESPPGNGAGAPAEDPEDFLALVGLAGKETALPSELSGGEQQRVAIARALAQRPELLLADEPTGHLDSDTGARVLDLIDAVRNEFGLAMVIATHDPAVAGRAGRTVELADGHITGFPVT